jgi:hypothetical protein
MDYKRGSVCVTADVDVSADDFWEVLRDWPAVMKWTPADSPAPLLDVTLRDGDDVDVLPCTRIMHFDISKGFPPTFEETLLSAHPEARRIIYVLKDVPGGLTNYMATTFIDDLGDGKARVTCDSKFDVPMSASLEETEDFLQKIYERSVIRGIERAIRRWCGNPML